MSNLEENNYQDVIQNMKRTIEFGEQIEGMVIPSHQKTERDRSVQGYGLPHSLFNNRFYEEVCLSDDALAVKIGKVSEEVTKQQVMLMTPQNHDGRYMCLDEKRKKLINTINGFRDKIAQNFEDIAYVSFLFRRYLKYLYEKYNAKDFLLLRIELEEFIIGYFSHSPAWHINKEEEYLVRMPILKLIAKLRGIFMSSDFVNMQKKASKKVFVDAKEINIRTNPLLPSGQRPACALNDDFTMNLTVGTETISKNMSFSQNPMKLMDIFSELFNKMRLYGETMIQEAKSIAASHEEGYNLDLNRFGGRVFDYENKEFLNQVEKRLENVRKNTLAGEFKEPRLFIIYERNRAYFQHRPSKSHALVSSRPLTPHEYQEIILRSTQRTMQIFEQNKSILETSETTVDLEMMQLMEREKSILNQSSTELEDYMEIFSSMEEMHSSDHDFNIESGSVVDRFLQVGYNYNGNIENTVGRDVENETTRIVNTNLEMSDDIFESSMVKQTNRVNSKREYAMKSQYNIETEMFKESYVTQKLTNEMNQSPMNVYLFCKEQKYSVISSVYDMRIWISCGTKDTEIQLPYLEQFYNTYMNETDFLTLDLFKKRIRAHAQIEDYTGRGISLIDTGTQSLRTRKTYFRNFLAGASPSTIARYLSIRPFLHKIKGIPTRISEASLLLNSVEMECSVGDLALDELAERKARAETEIKENEVKTKEDTLKFVKMLDAQNASIEDRLNARRYLQRTDNDHINDAMLEKMMDSSHLFFTDGNKKKKKRWSIF